jgi:Fe-S cluster assembly iron-binding protein IscA
MKKAAILLLMTVYGCASIPYNGKYTLNGEDVDYTIERKQCQIWATEKAIESLQGNEFGATWMRLRRKNMLACMKEKGFEWVQE